MRFGSVQNQKYLIFVVKSSGTRIWWFFRSLWNEKLELMRSWQHPKMLWWRMTWKWLYQSSLLAAANSRGRKTMQWCPSWDYNSVGGHKYQDGWSMGNPIRTWYSPSSGSQFIFKWFGMRLHILNINSHQVTKRFPHEGRHFQKIYVGFWRSMDPYIVLNFFGPAVNFENDPTKFVFCQFA